MPILDQCKICNHFHLSDDHYCDLFSEYIEESDGAVCEEGRVFVLNSNGESLQCPVCGTYTNSLKSYSLPKIDMFALVFRYHQDITYICCPSCMRKKILLRGFTYNILCANIAWPFTVLPRMVIKLIGTFKSGHSKEIRDATSLKKKDYWQQ